MERRRRSIQIRCETPVDEGHLVAFQQEPGRQACSWPPRLSGWRLRWSWFVAAFDVCWGDKAQQGRERDVALVGRLLQGALERLRRHELDVRLTICLRLLSLVISGTRLARLFQS